MTIHIGVFFFALLKLTKRSMTFSIIPRFFSSIIFQSFSIIYIPQQRFDSYRPVALPIYKMLCCRFGLIVCLSSSQHNEIAFRCHWSWATFALYGRVGSSVGRLLCVRIYINKRRHTLSSRFVRLILYFLYRQESHLPSANLLFAVYWFVKLGPVITCIDRNNRTGRGQVQPNNFLSNLFWKIIHFMWPCLSPVEDVAL